MRADLQHCLGRTWQPHFNQRDYDGDWDTISLRSASGEETNVYAHPDAAAYHDTPLLGLCPHIRATLDAIACEKEAVRLMRQAPGGLIKTHRDIGLGYADGSFRLHIPLHTNDGVEFVVAGTRLPMQPGECWYANFSEPHSVRNAGDSPRIHLVIDCLRNDWSDAWLRDAGFDMESLRPQPMPQAQRLEMMARLRELDSPTARQLLQDLESEAADHEKKARLDAILAFLDEIGIPWQAGKVPEGSFLPGILVEAGTLVIDLGGACHPGDILHEAGHIALLMPEERPTFSGDLAVQLPTHQGDEVAVILWTYAAALHLGLPLEEVIHDAGYRGDADWLRDTLSGGTYIGLPLLAWMGLCESDSFPRMLRWTRA